MIELRWDAAKKKNAGTVTTKGTNKKKLYRITGWEQF
jgi:hypothetical protein